MQWLDVFPLFILRKECTINSKDNMNKKKLQKHLNKGMTIYAHKNDCIVFIGGRDMYVLRLDDEV